MEAGAGAVDFRLKTLERETGKQGGTVNALRTRSGEHDVALAVQGRQLHDQEHDIARLDNRMRDFDTALKEGFKEIKKELSGELKTVRRSLYAATFTFTALILTAFGYILQAILAGH